VRLFSLCDRAFDLHIVNLAAVFSLLPLVLEVQVGASGYCVVGSDGWEIVALLRRL
jgi:hypothetical protein